MAAGAAVAYGLHTWRPVVASVSGLKAMTNFPVIGVVGAAFPTRSKVAFRNRLFSFSVVASVLVLFLGAALVLNWSGVRLNLHVLSTLVRA
jgi:hypothetical protein